jgi:hypothetical protein
MSSTNEILSSDEESVHNYDSHNEEDNTVEVSPKEITTEKKTKLSFEDFVAQHMAEFEKFKTEFDGVPMKDFYKTFSKFLKSQESFMGRLVKLHQKSGTKKKRKHTENTGKSGFNKPTPVPEPFIKYLELEDETEMTRPQLVKLLNAKFSKDGYKNESEICFSSKKIAKIFGVDKDHTFHAKDFHKFLATYYKENITEAKS